MKTLDKFEYFARRIHQKLLHSAPQRASKFLLDNNTKEFGISAKPQEHPFDLREIHSDIPPKVKKLFDDAHYDEAVFHACKFLDAFVGKHAPNTTSGRSRMMEAFKETNPIIALNSLSSTSEKDEQEGYKYLFAGTMIAIRNPRGHDLEFDNNPTACLDHLSLISGLLRRLNAAGFR